MNFNIVLRKFAKETLNNQQRYYLTILEIVSKKSFFFKRWSSQKEKRTSLYSIFRAIQMYSLEQHLKNGLIQTKL